MESPLRQTIANFSLANMENKILRNNSNFHPKLCLRYIDDILCVFNNKTSSDKFFYYLNKQHKNNQFTVEYASETLPLLNVEVIITEFGTKSKIFKN